MKRYCIAGIGVELEGKDRFREHKSLSKFRTEQQQMDLHIRLKKDEGIDVPSSSYVYSEYMRWSSYQEEDETQQLTIYHRECSSQNNDINTAMDHMLVNRQWSQAVVHMNDKYNIGQSILKGPIGEILFRNCILFHSGFVLHGAAIEWREQGIIFTAPSGTGKTTQANLWKRYKGATMVNEDRPAIRLVEDEVYVYGTPWNGSSPKSRNVYFPLKAIVIIERAKTNQVHRLSRAEGMKRLLPRCFLPYHNEELMERAMKNVAEILDRVPIYHLYCKPDKEAVERVYECMKLDMQNQNIC